MGLVLIGGAILCRSLSNFLLMGRNLTCYLTRGQNMVELMKIMATSFKNPMHTLLHVVPPTLQQGTTDPCLHRRLLNTHRKVWVSLL